MIESISIIIPTFNESAVIAKLILYLQKHSAGFANEVIVSDGGSTDDTLSVAAQNGAIVIKSPQKGRAAQMNFGAEKATGSILYFVHADCFPPETYTNDIIAAVQEGFLFGRYRTRFNSSKFLLKINAWFTRFNWFICYGGDQTLFVTKELFGKTGGFKDHILIMEEYEFTDRLMQIARYKIFPKAALVSARKYDGRSWLQVQLANRKAVQMYKAGLPQKDIIEAYKNSLSVKR